MLRVHHAITILIASGLSLVSVAASAYTNPTPQRSYVSIHGVDGNTCGVAAPCRTWQYAMDNETQPGGEVLAVDSGGFGTLNITKSIAIVVPAGGYGGISPPSGANGVSIHGAAAINVVLRGLTITSQPGALNGIVIGPTASVTVENCTIAGFGTASPDGNGIVANGSTINLQVINSTVRDNSVGIWLQDGPIASVVGSKLIGNSTGQYVYSLVSTTSVSVSDSTAQNNNTGYYVRSEVAGGVASLVLDRSTVTNNVGYGVVAMSIGGTATASVSNSLIAKNLYGIGVQGNLGSATVNGNAISGNFYGIDIAYGGTASTFGNNALSGNTVDVSGGPMLQLTSR